MRFTSRAPREGINVTPTHPLREASTLVFGLLLLVTVVIVIGAWGVDLLVPLIPPKAEAKAFESLEIDSFVEGVLLPRAGERRQKAQALLERLVRHWEDAPYDFQVFLLESSDPNAAALPGGHLLLTTGLVDQTESENELAFVLGHELGHFRHRDHLRALGRGMFYGIALGVLLGQSGTVPDLASMMGQITSRGYDRDQERDADRFGLALVMAEYGHVAESWRFLERLAEEESDADDMASYFSTHPASGGRVEALRRLAETKGWESEGAVEKF